MEKQILTREQAEALDEIFEKTAFTKDELIDLHAKTGLYRSLRDLSVSELAKALYIGYEVEPEFKVGDWIVAIGKTVKLVDETKTTFILDGGIGEKNKRIVKEHYRHATPQEIEKEKERRWWAEHGRDVWELRKGDVLICRDSEALHEVFMVTDDYIRLVDTPGVIVNPSYFYKVACFAEDRKDVEDND